MQNKTWSNLINAQHQQSIKGSRREKRKQHQQQQHKQEKEKNKNRELSHLQSEKRRPSEEN